MQSPCDKYVWPMAIATETNCPKEGDMFGYIMPLIPDGYYGMDKFLLGDDKPTKKSFKSYYAWLTAALNIVAAISDLHHKGLSYKDLQPKNFVINEDTGNILVVDNNNISAGRGSVLGTPGYMAPEIPRSGYQLLPNTETDYYSLAIVLFKLFYNDHPMEGKRCRDFHVFDEKAEEKIYYIDPIFCMDPHNSSNRPDEIFTPNICKRWDILFTELQPAFEEAFTEGINRPGKRITDNRWMKEISSLRDKIIMAGGREFFMDFSSSPEFIPPLCLKLDVFINNAYRNTVALYPSSIVHENSITGIQIKYNEVYAIVGKSKASGLPMIMNKSSDTWQVYSPVTKAVTPLEPNGKIELQPGLQFKFSKRITGKVLNPRRRQ